MADVITTVTITLRAFKEIHNRLETNTGTYNERLLHSLDGFLARVNAECIERREPSRSWLRDFEQLRDDVGAHVATCDRHATESGLLVLFKSAPDNMHARKLSKKVKKLESSMDFTAPPTNAPIAR